VQSDAAAKRPPIDLLKSVVSYDPDTGLFAWLPRDADFYSGPSAATSCKRWNTMYAGKPALKTRDGAGYLEGEFLGYRVLAHRAAWAIAHGEWPRVIDHIDGDPENNRIANLRDTSHFGNAQNRKDRPGRAGIVQTPGGAWFAMITVEGHKMRSPTYPTEESAIAARADLVARFYDENGDRRPPQVKLRRRRMNARGAEDASS